MFPDFSLRNFSYTQPYYRTAVVLAPNEVVEIFCNTAIAAISTVSDQFQKQILYHYGSRKAVELPGLNEPNSFRKRYALPCKVMASVCKENTLSRTILPFWQNVTLDVGSLRHIAQ